MRRWIWGVVLGVALLAGVACRTHAGPSVIVLALDGCDPKLLESLMKRGQLPHFARLRAQGSYARLGTSNPPQSPVAWATFVTGQDSGGHGIFDFLQRDPQTLQVVPSMTAVEGGRSRLLRQGEPFWKELTRRGIPATLIKVPAHFPPQPDGARALSGMGTPDLLGSYGTFTLYSEGKSSSSLPGGQRVAVESREGQVRAALVGPLGSSQDFLVECDRERSSALLQLGSQLALLKVGEWSDWMVADFAPASGMVRFCLRSLEPFQLYASPINLDPRAPAQPISSPLSFAPHLARCCGPFYTQGMAEDTKALGSGALSDSEFLQQSRIVFAETRALILQALTELRGGLLFAYVSGLDLQSHMYWQAGRPYEMVVEQAYRDVDGLLGEVLERSGSATVIVLSDHGFAPFRQSFDLNAWLVEQGYLQLSPDQPLERADWAKTRLYGVGFNGLYINRAGREAHGIVPEAECSALLAEVSERLLKRPEVKQVYRADQIYHGPLKERGPDLIIGYRSGSRLSWESALGRVGAAVERPNREHWRGDHLIDPSEVPGVLLCSRRLAQGQLIDLAPTILALFSQTPPAAMRGRNLLEVP